MIAFVNGTVRLIRSDSIVLDVGGVGYEVFVSVPELYRMGEERFVYTFHHVREDTALLYGFDKEEDYEVFMRLINVKGIGPRTAQNLLRACPGSQMIEAIENDDVNRLKALPGIGAKTASQIVLDLKGKFVSVPAKQTATNNPVWEECKEALLSLGYRANMLTGIQKELAPQKDLSVEQMITKALSMLAKRNGV